jgi:hypothetical protein
LIKPVTYPSSISPPTAKIFKWLYKSDIPLAKGFANSIPLVHSEVYPWANGILNFYSIGVFGLILSDFDKI